MERKIGEIFEYKGEWYQCMESPNGNCMHCDIDFGGKCPIPIKECTGAYRIDTKHVIFKKLEKVGEPIIYMSRTFQRLKSPDDKQCKYCYFVNQVCSPQLCGEESFLVEIKQTNEDMEEKKSMTTKFREYLSKVSEEQLEKDLDLIKKFNESGVSVDEFIKSQETTQMKPFDLEAAKQGHPVCCRNGRKARIICFDANVEKGKPIVALLYDGKDREFVRHYTEEGKDYESCSFNDLRMCYEPEEVKFKPFDLEEAKEGKPVCTRNGSKARIICFDRKGHSPIIAFVQEEGSETCHFYAQDGKCVDSGNGYDLLMLSEKKEGWVNVHKGLVCTSVYPRIYKSREEAVSDNTTVNRIDTVKISWEE